jgi:hypothetical protein
MIFQIFLSLVSFVAIFSIGEVISYFIFSKFDTYFTKIGDKYDESLNNIEITEQEQNNVSKKDDINKKIIERKLAIIKGILERFVLFLGLANELQQALTLFGALKLGTRITSDKEHRVSNDYFWIGNLLSVLIAILYFVIWKAFTNYILS